MYIATLGGTNRNIIIKFTTRYNEAAHRLLDNAQLATRLHFCEQIIGDVYMVVMDRIDGKSVWQPQQEKKPAPIIVSEMAEKPVCLLHDNDVVFGDLQDPNIFVASEGHVVLVEFDWLGKGWRFKISSFT